jgi:flagellar hook-length control protein FliK
MLSAKRSAVPTIAPDNPTGGAPAVAISPAAAQQPAALAEPTAATGQPVTPGAVTPATPEANTAEARLAPTTAHRLVPGGQPPPAQVPPDTSPDATAIDAKLGEAFSVPMEPASVTTGSPTSIDPSALAPVAPPIAATPVQHGPTTAPAASPRGDAGAASPSPAAQVAPALVSLAQAPAGGSRLTLRLDPAELGHVQIRIDRAQDAPARIEITAERPETLALLQRDQPQLQRALDQAGVPVEGRSLTFHVANQQTGGGQGWSGADTSGQSGGGSQTWFGASQQSSENDAGTGQPQTTSRWLRAGLDITA